MRMKLKFVGFCLFLLFTNCQKNKSTKNPQEPQKDNKTENSVVETQNEKSIEDSLAKTKEKIKFSAFIFPKNKKDSAMSSFMKQFSDDELILFYRRHVQLLYCSDFLFLHNVHSGEKRADKCYKRDENTRNHVRPVIEFGIVPV